MGGHTSDLVICSLFHRNPFRGFGATGGRKCAFSVTLADVFHISYDGDVECRKYCFL